MINFIDILLLLIIASIVITGWNRGFIVGVLDLTRWIGSLLIGLRFYPHMAELLSSSFEWNDVWLLPFSFMLVTILASILLYYLGSLILQRLSPTVHASKLNRILGLITGFLSGVITVSIISIFLLAIPLPDPIETNVLNSNLITRLGTYTDRVETALSPVFEEATQRTLNKLMIEPGAKKTIELPYTVANPTPQPELEAQMLELLNKERIANGLAPLKPDTALRSVAREHSTDMFRRGYFSHYSPEGEDAFARIREAGIRFLTAGENLALAPTLSIAHEGLMNSPGHRANILQKRFGRVGIGVMKGGPGRLMITQKFRN